MNEAQHKGPIYIYMVRGTRDHLHIAIAVDMEEKLEAIHSGNGQCHYDPIPRLSWSTYDAFQTIRKPALL